MTDPAWYAVHVRSNRERSAARHMGKNGVEMFLPVYLAPSRRLDRRVVLARPLFSGYLFARLDISGASRIEVLRAPGVVGIVGFGGRAAPIEDAVIESIRILTGDGGRRVRPHPLVKTGRRVRVTAGAFLGAEGILHAAPGKKPKLVVEIEFLGRAVAVPVTSADVAPVFD